MHQHTPQPGPAHPKQQPRTIKLLKTLTRCTLARTGSALLVMWITATVVFFAVRISGDPLEAIMGGPGSQASPEAMQQARETYGLNRPIIVQYLTQLWQISTLQFGDSYARKQPVIVLLGNTLWPTITLASLALTLAWVLAMISTLTAATSRGRFRVIIRGGLSLIDTAASVTPHFVLGTVLILACSIQFRILPATSPPESSSGLLLPVLTLAVPIAGYLAHVLNASLAELDTQPFILSARARGASNTRILFTHTLRHASLPAIALSSWAYGSLVSGAVVVESLFARPGIGRLLLEAATVRDVPLVIGAVTVIALSYIIIMLIADLLERLVNPLLTSTSTHPRTLTDPTKKAGTP